MAVRRLLPEPCTSVSWADAYGWPPPEGADRPHVRANFVVSVDGAVSLHGRVGALSTPLDHDLFQWLRRTADAVLVGAGTVRDEGYGPVRVPEAEQERRRAEDRSPVPPIIVVTRSGQLDWTAPLFGPSDSRPLIATTVAAAASCRREASGRAEVLGVGDGGVDLAALLRELRRRGMSRLLTEGGPTLLAELWRHGLVDDLCVTVTPTVAGGDGPRLFGADTGPSAEVVPVHVLEGDGDLFLRYRRAP